jgi:hypothetical protein
MLRRCWRFASKLQIVRSLKLKLFLCGRQTAAVEEGVEGEVLRVPAGRQRRRALRLRPAEHEE